jgi:hypothetical protein
MYTSQHTKLFLFLRINILTYMLPRISKKLDMIFVCLAQSCIRRSTTFIYFLSIYIKINYTNIRRKLYFFNMELKAPHIYILCLQEENYIFLLLDKNFF